MLSAVFVVVVAILGGPVLSISLVGIAGAAGDSGPSTIPDSFLSATVHDMTLEEKVGQLFVTYVYGSAADTVDIRNRVEFGVETPEQVVEKYHLGGIIYFNWTDSVKNPKQVAALSNGLQRAGLSSGAHIPLMIATDQEQGIVTRIGPPATQFPGGMALGAGRGDPTDDAQRHDEDGRQGRPVACCHREMRFGSSGGPVTSMLTSPNSISSCARWA